ncbi:MAG: hypothetical protein M3442_09590 [Chloroflexota bacterium]|nr:hypothetical protein [Chloroflexota bacterium]
MALVVSISPRRLGYTLMIVALCLSLVSVGAQLPRYVLGYPRFLLLVRLVEVDQEQSFPTWYAAATLLLCAVILAAITAAARRAEDGRALYWGGLGLLALGCSVEEVAGLHEAAIPPLRALLGAGGLLYFTWVVPGAAFALAVGLVYARFVAGLDGATRRRLILAGALYVAGALGVEMVGGAYAEQWGQETLAFAGLTSVEEFLEMASVAVLAQALLSYLAALVPEVRLQLGAAGAAGPNTGTGP